MAYQQIDDKTLIRMTKTKLMTELCIAIYRCVRQHMLLCYKILQHNVNNAIANWLSIIRR